MSEFIQHPWTALVGALFVGFGWTCGCATAAWLAKKALG